MLDVSAWYFIILYCTNSTHSVPLHESDLLLHRHSSKSLSAVVAYDLVSSVTCELPLLLPCYRHHYAVPCRIICDNIKYQNRQEDSAKIQARQTIIIYKKICYGWMTTEASRGSWGRRQWLSNLQNGSLPSIVIVTYAWLNAPAVRSNIFFPQVRCAFFK